MVGDDAVVGDTFVEDDGVTRDQPAHTSGEEFRRDDVGVGSLALGEGFGAAAMAGGVVTGAFGNRIGVDRPVIEVGVDLADGGQGVGLERPPSRYPPERGVVLQRIDVDVVDRGLGARPADRRYPRNVAVDHENDVGVG